jgi:hypothetical protein
MNTNLDWRLAQERQREANEEAQEIQLRREAGIRDEVPASLKLLGFLLVTVPASLIVARVLGVL